MIYSFFPKEKLWVNDAIVWGGIIGVYLFARHSMQKKSLSSVGVANMETYHEHRKKMSHSEICEVKCWCVSKHTQHSQKVAVLPYWQKAFHFSAVETVQGVSLCTVCDVFILVVQGISEVMAMLFMYLHSCKMHGRWGWKLCFSLILSPKFPCWRYLIKKKSN